VAGRAHAAEPHIDTAPRPFRALMNRRFKKIDFCNGLPAE